jgi:hypothetical protein
MYSWSACDASQIIHRYHVRSAHIVDGQWMAPWMGHSRPTLGAKQVVHGLCRKLNYFPLRGFNNLLDHVRELLERDSHLLFVFVSVIDATDAADSVT